MENRIKANPYIGIKDSDGTYDYKEGICTIKYEILDIESEKPTVRIISIKHKILRLEEKIRNAKKTFRNFFIYNGWVHLLRPRILISITLGMVIFYFGVIEPYRDRVDRFRWILARVIGVDIERLEYAGGGLFRLFVKRSVAYKENPEYVTFTFNPLNMFSKKTAYVTRWSKDAGYVTNEISFDNRGNVWIDLNGALKHGIFSGEGVDWDEPKGYGKEKISGHAISREDGNLFIIDKQ